MTKNLDASEIQPPARVLVGDDNQSHIVDMFGDLWCEEEMDVYDPAGDVDCPGCITAFEQEDD